MKFRKLYELCVVYANRARKATEGMEKSERIILTCLPCMNRSELDASWLTAERVDDTLYYVLTPYAQFVREEKPFLFWTRSVERVEQKELWRCSGDGKIETFDEKDMYRIARIWKGLDEQFKKNEKRIAEEQALIMEATA